MNGGQVVTTTTVTITDGPISIKYINMGLTDQLVSLDHLKTVETEVVRERGVTESCQSYNAMLREQLARANERISGLEKVR